MAKPKAPAVKLLGEVRENETIELGNHEHYDFIGQGSCLDGCFLDINGAAFSLNDATLKNCRIKVRRQLSNIRFLNAVFDTCTFEGQLVGCRFGFRFGESENANAYYRACDYSKATLDLCDFFKGDIDSIIWPSWPNFTVLKPAAHKKDWLSIPFPKKFKATQRTVGLEPLDLDIPEPIHSIDEEPLAITVNLSHFKNLDPEAIWPLVQDKAYIVFNGKGSKARIDI